MGRLALPAGAAVEMQQLAVESLGGGTDLDATPQDFDGLVRIQQAGQGARGA